MKKIKFKDLIIILRFFLSPRVNIYSLIIILKDILKIIITSPDLLRLNSSELSVYEEEKMVLILKEEEKYFLFFIEFKDGRIKKIKSVNFNFEVLDIIKIRQELEKEYSVIKHIVFMDKESHKNIVKEINKREKHPFLVMVKKFQEELQNKKILIYPLPEPLLLFLGVNLEEVVMKFSPIFNLDLK